MLSEHTARVHGGNAMRTRQVEGVPPTHVGGGLCVCHKIGIIEKNVMLGMIKGRLVRMSGWVKCASCGEQIRTDEKAFDFAPHTKRQGKYCGSCHDYGVMNEVSIGDIVAMPDKSMRKMTRCGLHAREGLPI